MLSTLLSKPALFFCFGVSCSGVADTLVDIVKKKESWRCSGNVWVREKFPEGRSTTKTMMIRRPDNIVKINTTKMVDTDDQNHLVVSILICVPKVPHSLQLL